MYNEILQQGLTNTLTTIVDSPEAFIELALAGERLRAVECDWLGESSKESLQLFARYDAAIVVGKQYAPTTTELHSSLDAALEAVRKFADTELAKRELQTGELALTGVDEVLQIALAVHRAGVLDLSSLKELSRRAAEAMSAVSYQVPELCEVSVAWSAVHTAPEKHIELYSHRVALADKSEVALLLNALLRKNARIKAAVLAFNGVK